MQIGEFRMPQADLADDPFHPVQAQGQTSPALEQKRYVSIRYSERLAEAAIEPSVGSRGDSYTATTTLWLRRSAGCTRLS
ncbi:hypothetical protein RM96_22630 [Cupriavidus sp. IDO]|nr:hypothetical protein RM96_22630 [Cupriavidus sp. IDO]